MMSGTRISDSGTTMATVFFQFLIRHFCGFFLAEKFSMVKTNALKPRRMFAVPSTL